MMAAARARIHEIARELPAENRFGGPPPRYEDETQGRIEAHDYGAAHSYSDQRGGNDAYDALPRLGADSADDEFGHDMGTEMRGAYDGALQRHEEQYRSDPPIPRDDSSGKYERGSSRGARDPYSAPASFSSNSANSYDPAAYEANYPKSPRQEPSYVGRNATDDRRDGREGNSYRSSAPKSDQRERRDGGNSYRREEQRNNSYRRDDQYDDRRDDRRGSYQPPRDETRAEGTGNRKDGYDDHIPGPPRVPDGFVVGVQPIRGTPSMSPQAVIAPIPPITPSRGQPQPYVVPQSTMGATPNGMMMNPGMTAGPNSFGGQSFGQMGMPIMQPMMQPMAMQPAGSAMPPMVPVGGTMMGGVRPHTSMRPSGHIAQPTEVEEARQGSKIGRFAWFVFGAAFGIFFAFFATGFGFGKTEEAPTTSFPPPAHLPAPVQVGQAPAPPPAAPAPQPPIAQLAPVAPPAPQPPAFAPAPPAAAPPGALAPQQPGVIASPQPFAPVAPQAAPPAPAPRPAPQPRNDVVRVRPAAPPPPAAPRERARNSSGSSSEDILGAALGN